MASDLSHNEAFMLYENGKQRRYNLLFAVHGGAFTVTKVIRGVDQATPIILGGLTLLHLSVGMILFTLVMVVDIFVFGQTMRAKYVSEVFGLIGKLVLIGLGLLLCAGWYLAGFGGVEKPA